MGYGSRLGSAAALALVMVLALSGTAEAQESSRSWSSPISPADTKVKLTASQRSSAATSCKTASAQRSIPTQAYYTQSVEWCYTITAIVGTPVAVVVINAGPQVNFVGNINQTRAWVQQPTRYRAYTQGHFNAEGLPWSNWYPWVDMTLRPNGQWEYSTGS